VRPSTTAGFTSATQLIAKINLATFLAGIARTLPNRVSIFIVLMLQFAADGNRPDHDHGAREYDY
jgi:hypothetical protein